MRLVLVGIIVILSTPVFAQKGGVQWMTIEEAFKKNQTQARFILMDVYTSWCGWCKRMDATTFQHPELSKYINENLYPVKFDAEMTDTLELAGKVLLPKAGGGRTHELAKEIGVSGYPTIVFWGPGYSPQPVSGYRSAKDLEPIIKFFHEGHFKKISWEDYQKNFKNTIVKD